MVGDVVLLLVVGSGSSVFDDVVGVLSSSPFADVHRSNKPCIIGLQTITLSGLHFFIVQKVIQGVFPSLGWSSCSPLGLCRDEESWIALGSFSGPSFMASCSKSDSLATLQILLCLNPVCDVKTRANTSTQIILASVVDPVDSFESINEFASMIQGVRNKRRSPRQMCLRNLSKNCATLRTGLSCSQETKDDMRDAGHVMEYDETENNS